MFNRIRKAAAIEAGKITFAILGVGATIGNFAAMKLWLMLPAAILVLSTWAILYRMMEVQQ